MDSINLLCLPEEVFYGYLFPKVTTNDTLRLRRTCRTVKLFADGYIRLHHNTQEREINQDEHNFTEFIRRDFPTSKLFINNRDTSIFDQPEVDLFLEKYADQISHLRVTYFSTCLSPAEDKFYVALKNLQHLEIEFVDASDRESAYIPPTFQNLKTLKLGEVRTRGSYYYDLVRVCVNLEHLKHPRLLDKVKVEEATEIEEPPFAIVTTEIEKRLKANPEHKTPLKVFDLKHHEEKETGQFEESFVRLMEVANSQGFRLWNVDSKLIGMHAETNLRALSNTLISVQNLSYLLFCREMQHLEVLKVLTLAKVEYVNRAWLLAILDGPDEVDQICWPRLRELNLNIDSDKTGNPPDGVDMLYKARDFLNFLFESVKRPTLTTLRLTFDFYATCKTGVVLPCPRAAKIVENCGNLTILNLYNWQGTNKALSQLWTGLEMLEEVILDKCKELGNVAFVGRNLENPTFLKLKSLKRFCMGRLDEMPKITDTIFNLVFKHLRIKEFGITSDKPISSVTINGIRALTEGEFQKSVEKFPFTRWSLENVGEQDWNQLKNEFRASHML